MSHKKCNFSAFTALSALLLAPAITQAAECDEIEASSSIATNFRQVQAGLNVQLINTAHEQVQISGQIQCMPGRASRWIYHSVSYRIKKPGYVLGMRIGADWSVGHFMTGTALNPAIEFITPKWGAYGNLYVNCTPKPFKWGMETKFSYDFQYAGKHFIPSIGGYYCHGHVSGDNLLAFIGEIASPITNTITVKTALKIDKKLCTKWLVGIEIKNKGSNSANGLMDRLNEQPSRYFY